MTIITAIKPLTQLFNEVWFQLLEHSADVFDANPKSREPEVDVKRLHAKIGELILENDFLESALSKAGLLSERQ